MTKTSKITYTAIFAAIATVLMYFEFPIPFMPPFLKVDLSGAVVLIGAFIFGIAPAITMIGIKDLIHLTQTQTAGSGEAADFLMLSTLVIIAVLVYRAHKSRKMAVIGWNSICLVLMKTLSFLYASIVITVRMAPLMRLKGRTPSSRYMPMPVMLGLTAEQSSKIASRFQPMPFTY